MVPGLVVPGPVAPNRSRNICLSLVAAGPVLRSASRNICPGLVAAGPVLRSASRNICLGRNICPSPDGRPYRPFVVAMATSTKECRGCGNHDKR
jgi:hypothetical protein